MRRELVLSLLLLLPLAAKGVQEKPFIVATRAKALGGDAKAQFDLGVSYAFGQGVTKNEVEAVAWYRKAAEHGYDKAQYNLGVCYDFGRGVPKDHAVAAGWYRQAAQQGHAKAQFNLGISCKYGQGVPRDPVEAHAWLSLAAKGGEAKALRSREEVALGLTPLELERAQTRAQQLQGEILAARPRPRKWQPKRQVPRP
jgi:TPR repeat protein